MAELRHNRAHLAALAALAEANQKLAAAESQSAEHEARAIAAEQKVALAVELATELRDRITAWIEVVDGTLKGGAK